MKKAKGIIKNTVMVFIGPPRQLLIRLLCGILLEDGDDRTGYMEKVNAAIPVYTAKAVDLLLDRIYPPEKYMLGDCHRIWVTERRIYALLLYKYYMPSEIYPDICFD